MNMINYNNFKQNKFLILLRIAGVSSIYSYINSVLIFVQLAFIYRYLKNDDLNGLWLTIFSVVSWIYVLDLGIGNSIRNLLQQAVIENNNKRVKSLISTGIVSSTIIFSIVLLFLIPVISYTNWNFVFNISEKIISNKSIILILLMTIIFTMCKVIISLLSIIYNIIQKNHYINLLNLLANILSIIFLGLFYFIQARSLIFVSIAVTFSPIVVNLIFYYNNFIKKHNKLFEIKMFDITLLNTIYRSGLIFLFLQLFSIVLYTTDSLIISHFLSPQEVSSYQYTLKIFTVITVVFTAILNPFWSLVTSLKYSKNYKELNRQLKKIMYILIFLSLSIICLCFFINKIVFLITGVKNMVPDNLIYSIAFFTIIQMFCSLFQITLNGLNILKMQLLTFGMGALINIPLSILFLNIIAEESYVVMLASIISLLPSLILLPVIIKRELF